MFVISFSNMTRLTSDLQKPFPTYPLKFFCRKSWRKNWGQPAHL